LSGVNRRRNRRWPGAGLVCHLTLPNGEQMPGVPVENISMSGVFLRTSSQLPVSTVVPLELAREGLKKMMILRGRIVSCVTAADAEAQGRTPGLGVRFVPYGPDVEKRLVEMLDFLATVSIRLRPPPLPPSSSSIPPPPRREGRPREPTAAELLGVDSGRDSRDPARYAVQALAFDDAAKVREDEIRAELSRAKEELEQQRQMVSSLKTALASVRGEFLRLEQENADLAARLAHYDA
jgi:hypothetical protein